MSETVTQAKPTAKRGPGGRFLPGTAPGPGNPDGGRLSVLRHAALMAATPEDVVAVIKSLLGKALEGDVLAAKVFLERVLGKPDQGIQVSGEIGVRKYAHINWEQLAAIAAACAIQEADGVGEASRAGASGED